MVSHDRCSATTTGGRTILVSKSLRQARTHDAAFENFVSVFYRIGHLGRADKLDGRYDLLSWSQEATNWLRSQGDHSPEQILPVDFEIAVIAHHDVDYQGPLDRFPFDCSAFGLNRGRWGRPATDGDPEGLRR